MTEFPPLVKGSDLERIVDDDGEILFDLLDSEMFLRPDERTGTHLRLLCAIAKFEWELEAGRRLKELHAEKCPAAHWNNDKWEAHKEANRNAFLWAQCYRERSK